MRRSTYFCDRCNTQLGEGEVFQIQPSAQNIDDDGLLSTDWERSKEFDRFRNIHFCRQCLNQIIAFAESKPEKPAEKNGGVAKRTAVNKITLDIGKVNALRKAGWTMKQIAEEMGCSEATIYNKLKEREEIFEEETK